MPSTPRILDKLPSLYRPEPGYDDDDLLLQLATAVGTMLDQLSATSAELMQAHWVNYADSAVYSAWLGRRRRLNEDGPLKLDDPVIDQFPYLCDLPRIAAMVDLAPWREPLRDRERVESFRRRVHRIVQLHRDGLGTLRALRNMTLASLPQIDADAPPGLRERSFTVEEFSGHTSKTLAVAQSGLPNDMVGPLMRWQIDSGSITAVSPMIVIEGVTAQSGEVDPTQDPIIERFDPASGTGIGIHYQGNLAAGEALALVPGYSSWLGRENGIDLAQAIPQQLEAVDPTADGPWNVDGSAPAGTVVDLQQTADHCVWAAVNTGTGSLWRHDGSSWNEMLSGLPEIRCLLARSGELLVGFSTGLSRLDIQPIGAHALTPDPAGLSGPAVNALAADTDGTVWVASGSGLARLEAGALVFTELGSRSETETEILCLHIDDAGAIRCGGTLGLFLHQPASGRWHVLRNEAADEAVDDWLELDLANSPLPTDGEYPVPPVHAINRGTGGDIWLGTSQGIARYRAREQRRTYTTLLEALPQVTEARVNRIARDVRGRLWFATDDGLFLFDQLDWFQRQGDALVRLPRTIESQDKPVFWRYRRDTTTWQLFAPPDQAGFQNYGGGRIGGSEAAIHALLWTDSAHARLGTYDGVTFTVDSNATPAALGMRYKPAADRIVDGGIAAAPGLPAGRSDWRYLQREEATPPAPSGHPAWTREGRLLPPPADSEAPFEGRYLAAPDGQDTAVFSFCPAARVWLSWQPRAPLAVTVRLARNESNEQIDPLILDRVWNELQRVRPAAVEVFLAVDETIERGQ